MFRNTSRQNLHLNVEQLEDRMMLSTVQVFASGDTGQEQFRVLLNEAEIGRTNVTQQLQTYTFDHSTSFTADQIRIEFFNDTYDPSRNLDRNLRVDAISVDGARSETESSSVFSTGTWLPNDGVTAGFGRGEVLNANGYFQYAANSGTQIQIAARGDEGTEQFRLRVRGVNVATFDASTEDQIFTYTDGRDLSADDIQIEFFNDSFDPSNGSDSNLFVDFIRIDGETFQTEDSSVFSTGTWRNEDGIAGGNGRGQYLNANGYFQYSDNNGGATTNVSVEARGLEGTERFNLVVRGTVVATQTVGASNSTYQFNVAGEVRSEDVRIEFINDSYDPANGIDRDLTVSAISINGQAFTTDSNSVFSTGTFTANGLAPGLGRGNTLHTNGYFQFGAISETARYRVTFDATWSPQTHPNFPVGGHFSGLIGATHGTSADFWSRGEQASAGIEDVAETGSKTQLTNEINQAIGAQDAENLLSGGGITFSPDSVALEFDASADFSLVTLVSMIAPSPDWFVGVDSLSLLGNTDWIQSQTISLNVYDAGTDNGVNFNSADIDNQNGTITRITDGPLSRNGSVAPVGTFRFERIA